MQHSNERKQSIIAGGLIITAGLFIAKFVGLFYAIPFNYLLESSENIAIYGVSYNIYSYILNICTAGFPFAIATMIAKYSSRSDYRTCLLIKKLSTGLMMSIGFVSMLLLMLFSAPFSRLLLPAGTQNTDTMRTVLIIISFALFFVPVLSSFRGFYQGLKQMEVYALSQVLEQIVRVAFLLIFSAIAIYLFHFDHIWAVYFGAASTGVAAILAIIHMRIYDLRNIKEIKQLAKEQTIHSHKEKGAILKELVYISFPYLFVSVLGYSDTIINTFFLKNGLEIYYSAIMPTSGISAARSNAEILTIIGAINYSILKLMSIPMILAPGFSGAIIPHITSAIEKADIKGIRKNITDCIDIVLYIGLPICFCLFIFARPLYMYLFPPTSTHPEVISDMEMLDLCVQVLKWFSIEAFLSTIAPIFTSLMMAVRLRKTGIRYLTIMVIIKFIVTYPLLMYFGYTGLIISSLLSMGCYMFLCMRSLSAHFQVHWKYTFHKLIAILLGLTGMLAVSVLFTFFGLNYEMGGSFGFIWFIVCGVTAIAVYFVITYIFGIPQRMFHLKKKIPV